MYVNEPGKKFDLDYYVNKHIAMVKERLGPVGLVRCEVDKAADPSSPFIAIGHLYFNSLEDCQNGLLAPDHSAAFMADMPNYTDATVQIQISEIIE
jgi:uncharacterized protein (TIGR02118 family)